MFVDCKSEKQWLHQRFQYLTASDAVNYCGMNQYDPNGKLHLWEEKCLIRKRPDISERPAVKFGKTAEEHIRQLFMLKHPEYTLQYDQFGLYISDEHPFMAATLDGLLLNNTTAQHEILEIKTATVHNGDALKEWTSGELPLAYWMQILHQSECLRWACGVWVVALVSLEWAPEKSYFFQLHYDVRDPNFIQERARLVEHAADMWSMIQARKRPATLVTL